MPTQWPSSVPTWHSTRWRVLDCQHVTAAHIAGASLGGAIGQLLAVHHPGRGPHPNRDHDLAHGLPGRASVGAGIGRTATPACDLPAPAPEFLRHVTAMTSSPGHPSRARHRRCGNLAHPQRDRRALRGDTRDGTRLLPTRQPRQDRQADPGPHSRPAMTAPAPNHRGRLRLGVPLRQGTSRRAARPGPGPGLPGRDRQ
jgi:hypothetical protein